MTKMQAIAKVCQQFHGYAVRDEDCLEAIRLILKGCNPERVVEVMNDLQDAQVELDYFECNEAHRSHEAEETHRTIELDDALRYRRHVAQ